MAESPKHSKKWCPLGRLSIQKVGERGGMEAVAAGAYNQALIQPGPRDPGVTTYLSTFCVGKNCPFYRRGLNPWGWGLCAAAPQRVGAHIIITALILAAAALLPYFWPFN